MTKLVNRTLISLALLLCTFASLAQNTKYYDYAGKFKILFEGTPETSTQIKSTDVGDLTIYQFIYQSKATAYLVTYVDYPKNSISGFNQKDLLTGAKNGFVGALNLTISDELFITYGKYQGIRFLANDGNQFVSFRDYLVDNRLYQLGIFQYGAISEQTENDFFDSFELVK